MEDLRAQIAQLTREFRVNSGGLQPDTLMIPARKRQEFAAAISKMMAHTLPSGLTLGRLPEVLFGMNVQVSDAVEDYGVCLSGHLPPPPPRKPRTEATVPLAPTDRVSAWAEFSLQQGEEGEAFRAFLALARAHNYLRSRGYIEDDLGTVTPTDKGHTLLTRAHGYEQYRTGGKP